jgi:hypothetical protein
MICAKIELSQIGDSEENKSQYNKRDAHRLSTYIQIDQRHWQVDI